MPLRMRVRHGGAPLALYSQDRELIRTKPNAMPESVTDRPTRSHEYVFLLSKSDRYYYDAAVPQRYASVSNPERPTSER